MDALPSTVPSTVEDARARANEEQRRASDPAVSAFVTASAGSGKTKLLTDRLLRLMLAGTEPGRIQCLTFTKAAAAEMALRLQRRLGRWVTLDDGRLGDELEALLVPVSPEMLDRARQLFAHVLDVPGSMRIGTIHAFCQSLLRRFPLEAGLSPRFDLIDEHDARTERDRARENELEEADPGLLATLAGALNAGQFGAKVAALADAAPRLGDRLRLPPEVRLQALRRVLQARFDTEAAVVAAAVAWDDAAVRRGAGLMAAKGSPAIAEKGRRVLDWLALPPELRAEHWEEWRTEFFTGTGPRAPGAFAAKKLAEAEPGVIPAMLDEAARIAAVDGQIAALRLAAASHALLSLAAPILDGYAGRKRDRGLLDYADLVSRTEALLRDPGAAWVMYKLDGGIDHLLLDEVQDTAPDQWRIAHTLSEEFFTGAGASRDGAGARTFFAVGDPKQSIFSFQGADPAEFDRSRRLMRHRVQAAGAEWRDVPLDVSFRSATPVLDLVDAVFADPAATPGVIQPGGLHHVAARAGQGGRVELWPLSPRPERAERTAWTVPDSNGRQASALQRLAETVARRVRGMIGTELPSRGRKLVAGDVLVLVRRRNAFARALVRALKAEDVQVAGLDRLDLQAQSAVQDLLALLDTLLLPEDDLSLACVLTSPLGGLHDADLIRLTENRGRRPLWETLRARAGEDGRWQAVVDMILALLNRADYVTPHALLAEILGEQGGRARLLARLGPEAAEPVDELLRSALDYGALHPPSLQGFLHWVRRAGTEVKREAEAAGNAVRVMTSHGAKGLQAPVVILPDTTGLPPVDVPFTWLADPATGAEWPVWRPSGERGCPALDSARAAEDADRLKEYDRLLYVALTRAEDRLIVCGWQTERPLDPRSWYSLVAAGFERLRPEREAFGEEWEGEVLSVSAPQAAAPDHAPPAVAEAADHAPLPHWLGGPPHWRAVPLPAEAALPRPLAPSRPENVRLGPVPEAASPVRETTGAIRRRRGTVVHELLQHLPNLPEAVRGAAAQARAAALGFPDAAAEALSVLAHPALADLFTPGPQATSRAEQPLSGLVNGVVVNGVVDRLAITDSAVLVADYKSGRQPPNRVEDTPVLFLRQMASYRGVLRGAFPGRDVRCVLVWTDAPKVVPLPDALLDTHVPGAQEPRYT